MRQVRSAVERVQWRHFSLRTDARSQLGDVVWMAAVAELEPEGGNVAHDADSLP